MNKKKVAAIIISLVLIVFIIAGVLLFIFFKDTTTKDTNKEQIKNETGITVDNSSISFANMKLDNTSLNLSDAQKDVLRYFDNDYFGGIEYDDLQRYPDLFQGSQISFSGEIKKIVKSTDTEYEMLVNYNGGTYDKDTLVYIKGEQRIKRFIEGDFINIDGRYTGIDTYTVDSKSYTIPTINIFNAYDTSSAKFDLDTINSVAKYIFGNDIKISEFHDTGNYLVTLDNQSNNNFKSFVFYTNQGKIVDSREFDNYYNNQSTAPETTERNLYISADLQHYIITVFDRNTHIAYLEYYDKSLKKIWSREFSEVDAFKMDYTSDIIVLVANNDLYEIDCSNGKDIIEPVLVGEKIDVQMEKDGIILIGNDKNDMIMFVDMKGNIVWKVSSKYSPVSYDLDYSSSVQIIDNNYAVSWTAVSPENTAYILLDPDGNILLETDIETDTDNY